MRTREPDLIDDLLARISAAADVPRAVLAQVEHDARRNWGGVCHYVRKTPPASDHGEARDARIRTAARAGVPVRELAARWGLTSRRVWQILRGVP